MHSFVPGDGADRTPAGWGVRRTARLAFPHPAALAGDAGHTERLRVYLTDLLLPHGLGLTPGALERGGQSYGEMAEALIGRVLPAGESVDLLVLAHAVPDITPGRATTTYLSHVCPGGPMAFAVGDQGSAAAFTALRLIRAYAGTGGLPRALLLVLEQSALPYDPGVPVALPDRSQGVALLFGAPEPGERTARPGSVTTRQLSADQDPAGRLGALVDRPEPVTALVAATLAAQAPTPTGPDRVSTAAAGQPGTGVWWALAEELSAPADPAAAPRRLVLADYDPGHRSLSLAAFDTGVPADADAGIAATVGGRRR